MSYQTFKVEFLKNQTIAKVSISRPKALNAMNPKFFEQIGTIFSELNKKENLRVAVLMAQGKVFTAGLDLKQYGGLFAADLDGQDIARYSTRLYQTIIDMQKPFWNIFECKVPVLVGIHGKCIGGGVDLISMCDIRYCTSDAQFTIKEIDIGMAADLGTLQFLPNIGINQSTFREMAYTGRFVKSQQAQQIGLVTKVLQSKQELQKQIMNTAQIIASKSPVGIYTLKQVMKRQLRKKIEQNLQFMARLNSSMLLTKDMTQAISAFLQKRKPQFPKL